MRTSLLLLVLLSLAFAPAPFPRRQRRPDEAKKILGMWLGPNRLLIEPGRLTYHPGANSSFYHLRIDASRRPATYDIGMGSPDRPDFLGIFKVEGDTLTLCYNPASRGRPTAFTGPGRGFQIEVYKRAKR